MKERLYSPKAKITFIFGAMEDSAERLLEALQRMVKEAGAEFVTSGIIDLYHTDTHSNSDVERLIVEGLDPGGRSTLRALSRCPLPL